MLTETLNRVMLATTATVLAACVAMGQTTVTPKRLKLAWDAARGAECYRVYERVGTNCTLLGTTTNLWWPIIVVPGAHVFSVTSSNLWGESQPAVLETPDVAPSIERLSITAE